MPHPIKLGSSRGEPDPLPGGVPIPWQRFIRFCQELRYGEIEKLAIQDGVPVLAETVTKKIKFT